MTLSRKKWVGMCLVIAAVLIASPLGSPISSGLEHGLSSEMQTLSWSFGAIFPTAVHVGPAPASTQVSIGLSLPVRDAAGLDSLVQQVSTPGTAQYHDFITPAEFNAQYAPDATTYHALASYFTPYGVSVTTEPNRLMLTVTGNPAAMGAAFHTSFDNYRMANGQVFFGPTSAPQIPVSLGVSAAYGFTNALYNTPANLVQAPAPATTQVPLACGIGGDTPAQIRTAYGWTSLPSGDTGTGMKMAIVDGYDSAEPQSTLSSDLSSFDSACSVGTATVSWNYPVQSTTYNSSASSGWGGEEDLDLQWSHVMGPGATIEMTFSPNAGTGLYEAVDWIVANAVANDISLSWGEPDVGIYGGAACSFECNASTDGSYAMLHPVLEAGAAEGISTFVASGDCGSADGTNTVSTDYPASDEDSTGVGGTVITLSGGGYGSEKVWSGNESGSSCTNGGGAGGGWAPTPQPWYQHGYGVKNKGLRGVPDVGITAGTFLVIYSSGSATEEAGTSDAAPMWAGITAVADQVNGGGLGLLNPALYNILRSTTGYNNSFHDVSTGTGNGYPPNPGWNPITGIGTPKINALVPALTGGGTKPTLNPLTATIAASVTSGAAPLSVTFTATASGGTGTYKLYDFNYGDGNATPKLVNSVTYQYTVAGAYPASVEVYDSSGNSTLSTSVLISVGTSPFTLGLAASSTTPAVGTAVTFTATPSGGTSPYSITYNFGDGTWFYQTTSTSRPHTFQQAGVYCAQATATDGASPAAGAMSPVVTMDVGGATGSCGAAPSGPTINAFTASPATIPSGGTTYLNVTATGGVGPLSYAYTGQPASCPSANATQLVCSTTATATTAYTVTVTVSDSASTPHTTTATASFTVNVPGTGPVISTFTASPATIPSGGTTYLNVTASGGATPYTYAYHSLPAGCTSENVASLACSPSGAGTSSVTVTVTGANGLATTSSAATFTVYTLPAITSFTASPATIPSGGTTFLNVTAAGGTGSLSYTYAGLPSDCATANTAALTCTSAVAGPYTVTVTVTDQASHTATDVAFFTVEPASTGNPPTIAAFTASPGTIPQGGTVYLNVTATGGTSPYQYLYQGLPPGCASFSTANLVCTPRASSTYSVAVTVTDAKGLTAQSSTTFTVTAVSSSQGSGGGLDLVSYALIAGIVILGVVLVVVLATRRKPPATQIPSWVPPQPHPGSPGAPSR